MMAGLYNAAVYPMRQLCHGQHDVSSAWCLRGPSLSGKDHAGQWAYDLQTFGGADWRQYFVPQTPNGPQWGPYLECSPVWQVQSNQFSARGAKEEFQEIASTPQSLKAAKIQAVERDSTSQTRDRRLSSGSKATTSASEGEKEIRDREGQDKLMEDLKKALLEVKEAELQRCSMAEFQLAKAQEEIQVRDEKIADLQHQLETAEEGLEHLLEELASRDKMIEILQDYLDMEEEKQETMEEALSSLSSDLQQSQLQVAELGHSSQCSAAQMIDLEQRLEVAQDVIDHLMEEKRDGEEHRLRIQEDCEFQVASQDSLIEHLEALFLKEEAKCNCLRHELDVTKANMKVSLIGSDLNSLAKRTSPLIEASVSMPRKSDKLTDVAADRDGRGQVDSVDHNIGAFWKDEAACELLLTSDCKAEYEVIQKAAKPEEFYIGADSEDEDLEGKLHGRPTFGTKSPTVRCSKQNFERHDMEDDLEEEDGSSAPSSPEEGFDSNSLQTDFLGEEVADEMVEAPQIEHHRQVVHGIREQDGFLPQELWPRLLSFLEVKEVMKMQTRAASRFFSDSKAWVAHLVQLMDLDALPAQLPTDSKDPVWKHPVFEWLKYSTSFAKGEFELVTEMKSDASEGFQGYRIWFNGLYTWHKLCPEMILDSVQVIMQQYGSTAGQVPRKLFWSLMASGVRQIRLPMTKGLLPVLCSKHLELDAYEDAIRALDTCRAVFHHLSPKFAVELLESVTRWTDERLQFSGVEQVIYMMDVMLDDRDLCSANYYMDAMALASKCARMEATAANKQKVLDLLMKTKESS
eukprot:Skav212170  [mRNA]  locus=scaffold754:312584:314986:+ [translate_table: standard]